MNKLDLLQEIVKTYQQHGWQLSSLLLTEDLQREVEQLRASRVFLPNVDIRNSAINAIWFSRPSGNRNAWEIRLISASPYALFETFAADGSVTERERVCRAMENRLEAQAVKFQV